MQVKQTTWFFHLLFLVFLLYGLWSGIFTPFATEGLLLNGVWAHSKNKWEIINSVLRPYFPVEFAFPMQFQAPNNALCFHFTYPYFFSLTPNHNQGQMQNFNDGWAKIILLPPMKTDIIYFNMYCKIVLSVKLPYIFSVNLHNYKSSHINYRV